ncbi:exodeoxyribonuclease I [Alteromonadaceae bacterium BrNp21-10]|nr:exodeoxyribonuclease I [Alteromonadaceae bacterium BrNp21-10]
MPPNKNDSLVTNIPSILWHDYETWGANPQVDRPSQFAAIRTDLDLNPIGKPINFYCQPPSDVLPQPMACLITGITPQVASQKGYCEAEFMGKVHEHMLQPNTCVVGYNNLRFDDEVTRYGLYRNFYDPYAREWKNGNSRWDIIDMVRACYALRPEGIEWPLNEDGNPVFKLEELAKANDIGHQQAHDALSDVYATIALAKLIKDKQPKLYQYLFDLRLKKNVGKMIDCENWQPLVHISSKLPASQGCCTWIVPIAYHPTNKNAVIVLNLQLDPTPLLNLSTEEIIEKLYQPSSSLQPGEQRLPIKLVHINKCPVLAPAKTLQPENIQRLGLDREYSLSNLQFIKQHPELRQKLIEVFSQPSVLPPLDADYALYSGGFFSDSDRFKMNQVIESAPEQLIGKDWAFSDPRLNTLLFRYRARNFPNTLSEHEMQQWQQHRQLKLIDQPDNHCLSLSTYLAELELLAQQYSGDVKKLEILKALHKYAEYI